MIENSEKSDTVYPYIPTNIMSETIQNYLCYKIVWLLNCWKLWRKKKYVNVLPSMENILQIWIFFTWV